mgnify:CR=1 FL=1
MEEITLVQIDAKETTFNDRNLMKELSQKIKETEMFKDFTDDEIHILTNYARAYQVNKGMPILREGEVDCYMCLVTEGEIDIFRECGNNCRLKICVVGKGQTIGEMSMVDGLPNSATAIASIDTSIVLFSKRHFVTLTSEHPEIASMIMWKLSELLSLRLRKTSSLLVDSATTSKGLREARDEALKKAKDKSAFFAGMSHELRTPLNAMIGYGELLKEINEENNTEVETAGDNVKAVDSMDDRFFSKFIFDQFQEQFQILVVGFAVPVLDLFNINHRDQILLIFVNDLHEVFELFPRLRRCSEIVI